MRVSVNVRPACLQDGVAVMSLLEQVGFYPEPISFAQTYRKTLQNPGFLVRVAEMGGQVVGLATLSLRYQLGIGGLVASLDELAIDDGPEAARIERKLRKATVGRARALGARQVINKANENTPPPRAAQLQKTA